MKITPIMRLLLLTALVAVSIWIYSKLRTEYGYVIAEGLLVSAMIVASSFGFYAVLFLILWPLGWLGQYAQRGVDPTSPFAEDRLPASQLEVRHEHDTTV